MLNPEDFKLTKKEFEVLREIMNDPKKRDAIYQIIQFELLKFKSDQEDAEEIAKAQQKINQA